MKFLFQYTTTKHIICSPFVMDHVVNIIPVKSYKVFSAILGQNLLRYSFFNMILFLFQDLYFDRNGKLLYFHVRLVERRINIPMFCLL